MKAMNKYWNNHLKQTAINEIQRSRPIAGNWKDLKNKLKSLTEEQQNVQKKGEKSNGRLIIPTLNFLNSQLQIKLLMHSV